MKISLRWLNEYVDVTEYLSKPEALAQLLTEKGLEVESVENLAAKYTHVVVGIIVDKIQHPDAERLTLCQVSTGEGRLHKIVCGAKNHMANDKVVVALPGAVLPNGMEIKTTKLRGVESQGMLCSAAELGLSSDHSGLLILPNDATVGQPFAIHMGLDDIVLELKVTPNRADCLSHLGLAREIGALLQRELKAFDIKVEASKESSRSFVQIRVEDPQGCPLYCARVVRGVKVGPSPMWLKNRLEVVGARSINNVVDITNYVMLELGQPLHAFDQKKLAGGEIIVRSAGDGEIFTTLFDQQLKLKSTDLTIRDGSRAVALAGVIGGQNSGISDDTTDVVIESAIFNMQRVRRTARLHNQQTDAAYRFSRGVNSQLSELAMNRACQLLAQVASGTVLDEPWVVRHAEPARNLIHISAELVSQRLGYTVTPTSLEACLRQLGCRVDKALESPGHFRVEPPVHRPDLEMEMDLVEEYARINGYDKIPDHLPPLQSSPTPDVPVYSLEKDLRAELSHRGLHQVLNYAFTSSKWQERILGDWGRWSAVGLPIVSEPVALRNPLSEDLNVMRSSLLPGVLQNVVHNFHQGNEFGRVYELGYTFAKDANGYPQYHRLALAAWGDVDQVWGRWSSQQKPMPRAFELKAHLQAVIRKLGLIESWVPISDMRLVPEIFHPAQSVRLHIGDVAVGILGTAHPQFLDEQKVRSDVAIAEVNLELLSRLAEKQHVRFQAFSRYPAVQRDLAFVVPRTFVSRDLVKFIHENVQSGLEQVHVFDQYEGKGLPEGQKSLALRLRFRKPDGTYTEAESQELLSGVINAACQKYRISVR